ncbi:MAG: LemA family protein [Candidatus Omnitrophica bacterium]|nr:LemA family protein [Candidatus Omnitrophota bacterium]
MLRQQRGSTRLLLIGIALNIVAMGVVFFYIHYRRILNAERDALEAQVQIVKACHLRTELLTPLIKMIKDQAEQEQQVLTALIDIQEQSLDTIKQLQKNLVRTDMRQVAETQVVLIKTVERVDEWVNAYPGLKESESFIDLRKQFDATRDSVDAASQTYNQAVGQFNSRIASFPGMFIAPVFGWVEKGDYEVRDIKIYFQEITSF